MNTKEEILNHFNGISGLANALGIKRQAIYQWDPIPNGRAYEIEILSDRKFRAEQIKGLSFRNLKHFEPENQTDQS